MIESDLLVQMQAIAADNPPKGGPRACKQSIISQEDGASAHTAMYTRDAFKKLKINRLGTKAGEALVWPPNSPDINPRDVGRS